MDASAWNRVLFPQCFGGCCVLEYRLVSNYNLQRILYHQPSTRASTSSCLDRYLGSMMGGSLISELLRRTVPLLRGCKGLIIRYIPSFPCARVYQDFKSCKNTFRHHITWITFTQWIFEQLYFKLVHYFSLVFQPTCNFLLVTFNAIGSWSGSVLMNWICRLGHFSGDAGFVFIVKRASVPPNSAIKPWQCTKKHEI